MCWRFEFAVVNYVYLCRVSSAQCLCGVHGKCEDYAECSVEVCAAACSVCAGGVWRLDDRQRQAAAHPPLPYLLAQLLVLHILSSGFQHFLPQS